ncbi:DUF397 domain-containing protein [Streptomyces sp. ME02-6978a]|uniref:DUF397 domain-containing protein n=1 Tax=unclassified Streptomyces TaxID=2593676 RepID=UPI0029B0156A|nr:MULTISPECIES: DUF397 domain-containing protein [unclassified Streptomyces]MDX3091554.1 DUF397 domain-containing protein [Streptomyces sp. ME12-02E]MDX3335034.1 DUF397 domain-containing protein [Streptomyces sp. ME02-6978a]
MRAAPGLSTIRWRKSSYSNADGGNCVEVADGFPGAVPVRDSKNTDGPALELSVQAWDRFVNSLKDSSL